MAHNAGDSFYLFTPEQGNSSSSLQQDTSGEQHSFPSPPPSIFDSADFDAWIRDGCPSGLEELSDLSSPSIKESQAGLVVSGSPTTFPDLALLRMSPAQHTAQPRESSVTYSEHPPLDLPSSWSTAFDGNNAHFSLPLDGANKMDNSSSSQHRQIPTQATKPWQTAPNHFAPTFSQSAPAGGNTNMDMDRLGYHRQGRYTQNATYEHGGFAQGIHKFEASSSLMMGSSLPHSSVQPSGPSHVASEIAPHLTSDQPRVYPAVFDQRAPSSFPLVGPSITEVSLADGSQVNLRYDYDNPRDAADRFASTHQISETNKTKLEAYLRGVYRQVWGTEYDDDDFRYNGRAETPRSFSEPPASSTLVVDKTVKRREANAKRVEKRKQTRRSSTVFIPKDELRALTAPLSQISTEHGWPPRDVMTEKIYRPAEKRHADQKKAGTPPRPCNSWILYRWTYQDVAKQFCGSGNQQSIGWIISDSWKMETEAVKEQFAELAREEERMHALAWPGYKYKPSAPGVKQEQQAAL